MALDYGARTAAENYPGQNRLRSFVVNVKTPQGPYTFIPLFITAPPPESNTMAQGDGGTHGTKIDQVDFRIDGAANSGATAQLAYMADGSASIVNISNTMALDGTLNTLTNVGFATTNADGTPGVDGMAPVVPDNCVVGVVLSADLSGGSAETLTLRVAVSESLG